MSEFADKCFDSITNIDLQVVNSKLLEMMPIGEETRLTMCRVVVTQ